MTALESSFGVILLALDKRRPRQMNIKECLECYVDHRREVILRRTQFRLRKAEDRAHILEGYKIAQDNLDEFVRIIRASANRNEAKINLVAKFTLSERQVNAILDLRLYQLTGMEREKIEEEYQELMGIIAGLKEIIENEHILLSVIKDELRVLRDVYADERKCTITEYEGDVRMEDLIPNDGCVITITKSGFIKRTGVEEFRSQNRGGKGVIGSGQKEDDPVNILQTCNAHDTLMFFMENGRVYVEKAYEIPEGSRISKGRNIINLLEMQKSEKVAALISIDSFESDLSLVLCTRNGVVKKTKINAYKNHRKGGIIGINVDEGDRVLKAIKTNPEDHILILTKNGKTHAAEYSYNNHWGVPLTLARMPERTDFAIIEIGMNNPNEIRPLAKLAKLDIAIVLNVAPVHLKAFKNVEGIAYAKAEIFESLSPNNTAIVNSDLTTSHILFNTIHKVKANLISFGRMDVANYKLISTLDYWDKNLNLSLCPK